MSRVSRQHYWRVEHQGVASLSQGGHLRAIIVRANRPLFTFGLVQRGFSDEDIHKVIGGNVYRV